MGSEMCHRRQSTRNQCPLCRLLAAGARHHGRPRVLVRVEPGLRCSLAGILPGQWPPARRWEGLAGHSHVGAMWVWILAPALAAPRPRAGPTALRVRLLHAPLRGRGEVTGGRKLLALRPAVAGSALSRCAIVAVELGLHRGVGPHRPGRARSRESERHVSPSSSAGGCGRPLRKGRGPASGPPDVTAHVRETPLVAGLRGTVLRVARAAVPRTLLAAPGVRRCCGLDVCPPRIHKLKP